jgi:hypothetical protein
MEIQNEEFDDLYRPHRVIQRTLGYGRLDMRLDWRRELTHRIFAGETSWKLEIQSIKNE